MATMLNTFAQEVDTLRWAQALNTLHKYNKSYKLLNAYYPHHKDEIYAGWMYANALHQTKKYKKSQEIYSRTIQLFPDNIDLKLDYAIKLAESGNFEESVYQLNEMNDSLPIEYLFAIQKTRAKIYYWQGKYDESLAEINQALELYNNDPEAIDLKNNISLARSNWLIIDASYFEDDQPLKIITPTVETIFYKNAKLSGGLSLNAPLFFQEDGVYSSQWLNAMIQFQFLPSKIRLRLNAGFIKFPSNDFDWTGAVQVYKKFAKHMELGLIAERKPYLSTEASVNEKVMQTTYGVFLSWNDANGWLGNASFDLNRFPAYNNQYYTVSAWLVTPELKMSVFGFRIGYGFNYSDSEESNFISKYSLNEIVQKWDTATEIPGVYDPFFSPNKQTIHSAILIVSIIPSKKIGITLNTNYGFIATAKTPYLFLNNGEGNGLFIDRGFFDDSYHPIQFDCNISYNISPTFSINGNYTYQSTNFYVGQVFGLTTILHF